MDRYQTNDGFALTEDLLKIFQKALNGGWGEDDLMDAVQDALGEAGYSEDDYVLEDDAS